MVFIYDIINTIQDFIETGGDVLVVIAVVIAIMWLLIFERLVFVFAAYRTLKKQAQQGWSSRTDHSSWHAHHIRQAMVSRMSSALNNNLSLIQSLVVLCPLLGLLGTVTGMIEVFDVMAISGSGNARSMASGVSKATIPTMAGMVGSLSGVFAVTWLQRFAKRETQIFEDSLSLVDNNDAMARA
ncbi:MotA/TolQ/ExbB proton channel family protein [Thalassotalea agarivorans]|uniref:Outer membrane transport energization protein ExbB (TC 2.C.1.1.1) n=1 Tax=Thalassotalea agarivorans TaxID=349064 RepID=A0A1I0EK60_THASX|nr:MotA/TolQ/ExbB proton channel family protein [Thalassotalea agarivorans]SET45817.1 outer membrane transport energization protein ExbB (TC 2.C.1.1.1) [Thalassotalea agarivorans]